jgi:hypothetical protein
MNNYKHPYLPLPDGWDNLFTESYDKILAEADKRQPRQRGEFTRHAAAIHEASHCVVAVHEGDFACERG